MDHYDRTSSSRIIIKHTSCDTKFCSAGLCSIIRWNCYLAHRVGSKPTPFFIFWGTQVQISAQTPTTLLELLWCFPQHPYVNAAIMPQIGPRLLPSTSVPIRHSLTFLSSDAVQCEMTAVFSAPVQEPEHNRKTIITESTRWHNI